MGNSPPIIYAVPIGNKKDGETQVYRHPEHTDKLLQFLNPAVRTIKDYYINTTNKFKNKNFLGTKDAQGAYQFKSYQQIFEEAQGLGSALINKNLIETKQEYLQFKLKMIGIFSKNREEWVTVDCMNVLYGFTMAPLYDTLGPESITYVIENSGIKTMFVSAESAKILLNSKDISKLKTIITFEVLDETISSQFKQRNIEILNYKTLIGEGQAKLVPFADVKPDDVFSFSYTSGTTGNPKAVMLSHENVVATLDSTPGTTAALIESDVHLSYLPLPHIFERLIVQMVIYNGATICFYGGDTLKLLDDIQVCKPTVFFSVPRIYNRFYDKMKSGFSALEGCKKSLGESAQQTKLENVRSSAKVTHGLWDCLIFNKTKQALGGNVRYLLTGSAPISTEVLDFLKIAVCCPFIEGYAQTETCAGGFLTNDSDPVTGHVGGVVKSQEFKLIDVVDMKYTSNDKDEKGNPTPRGEILVRGYNVFKGYYKEPEKTKEALDNEGWLHSGDIGMVMPNGSLKIIDRRKNIFKLAQGEYVAPEKVENIYMRARGVQEVFLHGESLQSFCVAIIVPNKEVFMQMASESKIAGTYEELCVSPQMNKLMLDSIKDFGKKEGLVGFEQAQKILLEPVSFMIHGCLTNTLKLQRQAAKDKFKQQIADLYKQ